ncbi:MAG: ribose-phosphate diphosphokinase [Sandaracinaceae bacterium]
MDGAALVYSTAEYAYLRDALVDGGRVLGTVERTDFPDGERMFRIRDDVADHDVILAGGTTGDAATLELYDLACGLVTGGARQLTLVIPYFGYSTMERAVHPGEVVTAKVRARLFSSIPPASFGNRALLLDLHSEGIPHYFEGELTAFHVYGKSVVKEVARGLFDDFVVACTDTGRAKWVESLANDLGVPASFVFKRRLTGRRTEVVAVDRRVRDRDVIIYDDMIRTGSSLLAAGRAYREAGARRMVAIATHGLFPGRALEEIRASGLFERVVTTDSHPRARALADDFLEVRPVHHLFEPFLQLGTRRGRASRG